MVIGQMPPEIKLFFTFWQKNNGNKGFFLNLSHLRTFQIDFFQKTATLKLKRYIEYKL
jgi:hypothetical protein